jgi:ribonuclease HI
VRVFGWRVATDTLAIRKNKWRRVLELDSRCSICSNDVEDAHHATVRCPRAAALRHAMRDRWNLPDEKHFAYTGRDWLQILLGQVDDTSRSRILLLLWRAWHLRNDVIHNQGRETIERSVAFLETYDSPEDRYEPDIIGSKGKAPMHSNSVTLAPLDNRYATNKTCWQPPPEGWIKINIDASFNAGSSLRGAGAVARDCKGKVILAACSPIQKCGDAEQAEAIAAMRGLKLLEGMGHDRILLESDYTAVVAALRSPEPDRSMLWSVYNEAKMLLKGKRAFRVMHTRRENNRVADGLAVMARSTGSCIWTAEIPDHIQYLVTEDCTSVSAC